MKRLFFPSSIFYYFFHHIEMIKIDVKLLLVVVVLTQLVHNVSVDLSNAVWNRLYQCSTSAIRNAFNSTSVGPPAIITHAPFICCKPIVYNEQIFSHVSSMAIPNTPVMESMCDISTGNYTALSTKMNRENYPHSRILHIRIIRNHHKDEWKKRKKHVRSGRGARFGRGGGLWRHKCPRRLTENSRTSIMWWLPNICISFCERNFPGKSFRGCVAGDGPTLADGTNVTGSGIHAMSLGDMSQILRHMKGECRSGRCIIELSFDNQVTFEVFRNHSVVGCLNAGCLRW
jgi:hypothetical protein